MPIIVPVRLSVVSGGLFPISGVWRWLTPAEAPRLVVGLATIGGSRGRGELAPLFLRKMHLKGRVTNKIESACTICVVWEEKGEYKIRVH